MSTKNAMQPPSVFDLDPAALGDVLTDLHEPAYRTGQILKWIYSRGATTFEEMTDLSADLRRRLADRMSFYTSSVVEQQEAKDKTQKLLLRWPDGATTECVLIPDGERRTGCISTQVGCAVGCVFCASGLNGLDRHLTAGQIVEQAVRLRSLCGDHRLSNVVFMGLGEPLHNYDATLAAVRAINAEWGLHIAARRITISTVGLPKQMMRLADECLQVTLALSLHAPNDALRRKLIPWAEGVTIESLIKAANHYFDRTGREITIEYVLLAEINDAPEHARELAALVKRMRANVNLLRYNPVEGLPYARPSTESAERFQGILRNAGINCHLRRSRGQEIDSACGQLRRRHG